MQSRAASGSKAARGGRYTLSHCAACGMLARTLPNCDRPNGNRSDTRVGLQGSEGREIRLEGQGSSGACPVRPESKMLLRISLGTGSWLPCPRRCTAGYRHCLPRWKICPSPRECGMPVPADSCNQPQTRFPVWISEFEASAQPGLLSPLAEGSGMPLPGTPGCGEPPGPYSRDQTNHRPFWCLLHACHPVLSARPYRPGLFLRGCPSCPRVAKKPLRDTSCQLHAGRVFLPLRHFLVREL